MKKSLLFISISMLILIGCKEKNQDATSVSEVSKIETVAMVPNSWIANRVAKTKSRLQATDAGKVVWNALEAHGGLERWFANGYLSFHFNYQPLDDGTQRNTYQIVDTWRNRVRQKEAKDTSLQYGWNGKTAWKVVKDSTSIPYDTRFWALTPYYFAGLPFVLDGEGVNLALLPQTKYKNAEWDVVKVTFDEGTGDAPDDYYILYFHKDTHKMGVIRYIVSYPAYFAKGKHMPEKFMDLFGEQTIDGIRFPESYKTHQTAKNDLPGEHITDITLSEIAFVKNIDKGHFDAPEGAVIVE